MIGLPKNMIGPWSPKGYLLLRHVVQCLENPTMALSAEVLDTSEFQLRRIIHRDNDKTGWFWRFINILETKGWPILVLFEEDNQIRYDAVEALPFDMEVEWKTNSKIHKWHSQSKWLQKRKVSMHI